MTLADATHAYAAADAAWDAELRRVFGRDACNARYLPRGHGEAGTELRRLHDACDAARAAWDEARAEALAAAGGVL